MAAATVLPLALLDLVTNVLVYRQLAPYLSLPAKLKLAATSSTYRHALLDSPDTFRYLDLSNIKGARLDNMDPIDQGGIAWRAERMDENLTEDEFYCGPLRGIFARLERLQVLASVQTLILDTLSCPADLVHEIATDPRFSVRLLSLRQVTHLNDRKLMQVLRYLARPSRPESSPRLKAVYYFGAHDTYHSPAAAHALPLPPEGLAPEDVMSSPGAQIGAEWNQRSRSVLNAALHIVHEDRWYQPSGKILKPLCSDDWALTLSACEGVIAFDAVLCRSPRHSLDRLAAQTRETPMNEQYLEPKLATVALGPAGCVGCSSSCEGEAVFGRSPEPHLPLLSPPPLHSSAVRYAQMPSIRSGTKYPPLFVRCDDCLRGRFCERCFKWWDENCYAADNTRSSETGIRRDCIVCGRTCAACAAVSNRTCSRCTAEFCMVHNEGWREGKRGSLCDWCSHRGRPTRELY